MVARLTFASWIPAAAAVRASDDFQEVPARILEIETAPTVVLIGLTRLRLRRIGPVGKRPFANPAKNFVELFLVDKEGIVLRGDLAVGIHEIDIDAVVGRDHEERPPSPRSRQAKDLGQERRRCFAVFGPHDGVIEINGHASFTARARAPVAKYYGSKLSTRQIVAEGHLAKIPADN